jgi:hypothetical protein
MIGTMPEISFDMIGFTACLINNFTFRMDLKVDHPTKSKENYAALCNHKLHFKLPASEEPQDQAGKRQGKNNSHDAGHVKLLGSSALSRNSAANQSTYQTAGRSQ